ncbi:MAG: hypothetical protein C4583_18020 [Anaerolineaceae bacterium]|nr:MAG: hypothetical protein C4583_18020 [Anaerolineaceae bacterium]
MIVGVGGMGVFVEVAVGRIGIFVDVGAGGVIACPSPQAVVAKIMAAIKIAMARCFVIILFLRYDGRTQWLLK